MGRGLENAPACPLTSTGLDDAGRPGGPEEDLQWRPLRKGIADLHRRAEVSQKSNERLLNALANVDDSRSVEELTADIQKRTSAGSRMVRGLRPWAEDKELFAAVNHGDSLIKWLPQPGRTETPVWSRGRVFFRAPTAIRRDQPETSVAAAHGLIQKVPHTHRYHVSAAGRAILIAFSPPLKPVSSARMPVLLNSSFFA